MVWPSFVTGNDITSLISTSTNDAETITLEGHTVSGGVTTFVVQSKALNGQTAVALDTPLFRVTRMYNASTTNLEGNVAAYEGGATTGGKPDTDSTVHALITAGEQQTQKASTTISDADYWIINQFTLSDVDKANSYSEARIEIKPVGSAVWRPVTQNIAATDSAATTVVPLCERVVVPPNHDVRIAVRCNIAGVTVAGGMQGILAKVINP